MSDTDWFFRHGRAILVVVAALLLLSFFLQWAATGSALQALGPTAGAAFAVALSALALMAIRKRQRESADDE